MANTLQQRYENQNWWANTTGEIGEIVGDLGSWVSPSAVNNIKRSMQAEDMRLLEKALGNALEEYYRATYNHIEDPQIKVLDGKINGVINSLSVSAPSNYKYHFKVLRELNAKLADTRKKDDVRRVANQIKANVKQSKIQEDIDSMKNIQIDPDSGYTQGLTPTKKFYDLVEKYT